MREIRYVTKDLPTLKNKFCERANTWLYTFKNDYTYIYVCMYININLPRFWVRIYIHIYIRLPCQNKRFFFFFRGFLAKTCKEIQHKTLYKCINISYKLFFQWIFNIKNDKIIGLFCRILSLLFSSFAKETYNFKEPTNGSHPI